MRFTLNQRGVTQFAQSAEVGRSLEREGDKVKREVEQQAERFQKTRRFARSIRRHESERTLTGQRVTVDSSDFAAHIVEYGSQNNPPYAPFRKAASALGLRLRGGGKRA